MHGHVIPDITYPYKQQKQQYYWRRKTGDRSGGKNNCLVFSYTFVEELSESERSPSGWRSGTHTLS